MGATTGIEWTDSTWSPIRVRVRHDAAQIARVKGYPSLVPIAEAMAGRVGPHCERVSMGCDNCYAATLNHRRLPPNGTGLPYDRRSRDLVEAFVDEDMLLQSLRWKRGRKIFVENQSDIFGDWVRDEMLDRVYAVMALCPQHTFQVLTKRPERMLAYLDSRTDNREEAIGAQCLELSGGQHSGLIELPLPNAWHGVSVEDQKTADKRIPLLLQVPSTRRFISAEPLLGQIDVWHYLGYVRNPIGKGLRIDWVIVGGESGRGARPMHPDWARILRGQCVLAGVPYFFKQWGEWAEVPPSWIDDRLSPRMVQTGDAFVTRTGHYDIIGSDLRSQYEVAGLPMRRVGKKASGSLLDGVAYKDFPEVRMKPGVPAA